MHIIDDAAAAAMMHAYRRDVSLYYRRVVVVIIMQHVRAVVIDDYLPTAASANQVLLSSFFFFTRVEPAVVGNGNGGVPTRASTLLGRSSPPFILLPRLGRSSLGINSQVHHNARRKPNAVRTATRRNFWKLRANRRQLVPTGANRHQLWKLFASSVYVSL